MYEKHFPILFCSREHSLTVIEISFMLNTFRFVLIFRKFPNIVISDAYQPRCTNILSWSSLAILHHHQSPRVITQPTMQPPYKKSLNSKPMPWHVNISMLTGILCLILLALSTFQYAFCSLRFLATKDKRARSQPF